ncbi:MAG: AMP-binding protein, partial [Nitrospinota bacterium]
MVLEGATPFPQQLMETYYDRRWWSGMSLGQMLDRSCDVYPDKEALVAGESRLTYRELRDSTDRTAIAFIEQGIQKLDRVLLQIPNWPEFVYAYYGLHKIGAIPVMCRPRFSEREIAHFLKLTDAKAWIVPLRYRKTDYVPMIAALSSVPTLKHIFVIAFHDEGDSLPEGAIFFERIFKNVDLTNYPGNHLRAFRPDPCEICHLMPTGGSTGLPKLVPRTHDDFLCNVEYRTKAWERSPRDITLIATPVTHNMAIEVSMNPGFLTGGKVVMTPSTETKDILETIQKEKVTTMI